MITLYSTNCPKCKVLEKKLIQLSIPFHLQDNDLNVIENLGYMTAPILAVNDNFMTFEEAIKWIKEWERKINGNIN